MPKVSDWILVEDGCGACRVIEGTDPNNIANRVAFIEKTPRIRIREAKVYHIDGNSVMAPDDWMNWASGPMKGDGPEDEEARKWCDDALRLFGYEV